MLVNIGCGKNDINAVFKKYSPFDTAAVSIHNVGIKLLISRVSKLIYIKCEKNGLWSSKTFSHSATLINSSKLLFSAHLLLDSTCVDGARAVDRPFDSSRPAYVRTYVCACVQLAIAIAVLCRYCRALEAMVAAKNGLVK